MQNPCDMTPQERWARVGEILYRGVCLLEMERCAKRDSKLTEGNNTKKEYSLSEAAGELAVSKRTIQRWVRKGMLIPVKKLNGYSFIPLEQIDCLKGMTTATHFDSKFG